MDHNNISTLNISVIIGEKIKAFMELLKFRLTFLVVFSSAFGYVLGINGQLDWILFLVFCLGGFMMSGGAVALNQVFEVDFDKVMKRTRNRPLPTSRLNMNEALVFSILFALTGFIFLWIFINPVTAVLSMISLAIYAFVYTPLKRIGPVAVPVGAIPGALPPLLGWTAATGSISYEALILFGIQFVWQFPHFWAIAWIADEDYNKAGFKLLPGNGKKDINTAFQIMIYTLFLIPLGLLPAIFGLTGLASAVIATICGVLFLAQTFRLMKKCDRNSALWIMYSSFIYLPIVQIAYLIDKV